MMCYLIKSWLWPGVCQCAAADEEADSMSKQSDTSKTPLVKILGKHGSALAYAIRDFLYRSGVPFEWVQLSTNEQARSQAGVEHLHDSRLPVCVFPDGTRMEGPTIRQIT